MRARMENPAMILPEAMKAMRAPGRHGEGGPPPRTLALVHLRASQVNGCSVCIDLGIRSAMKGGESLTNVHNHLNVATGHVAGERKP